MAKRPPRAHIPSLTAFLGKVKVAAVAAAEADLRAFAHEQRDAFVERIRQQDFDSFRRIPLSWAYRLRKRFHHLDPRTMIATGTYLDSIQVHERTTAGRASSGRFSAQERPILVMEINIDPSARAMGLDGTPTNVPMRMVAAVNEFGSSAAHVPARPHWAPFFLDMATNTAPVLGRRMTADIARALRRVVFRRR